MYVQIRPDAGPTQPQFHPAHFGEAFHLNGDKGGSGAGGGTGEPKGGYTREQPPPKKEKRTDQKPPKKVSDT